MLKFDPHTHTYSFGDEILPSITQILAAEGCINTDWYTAEGRERGSIGHLVTHLYDTGELIEDEIAPEYIGYLTAYKAFLKDTGFKVINSEVPRWHKIYRYAGTPDKVGTMGKYYAVVDEKTGGKEPWHPIQTVAQAELVKQDFDVAVVKRFSLYLRSDGTYQLCEHTNRQDTGIWTSLVAIHHWKRINLRRE